MKTSLGDFARAGERDFAEWNMRTRTESNQKPRPEARRSAGKPYAFRVLFLEDPEGWSAQVLEHDIATQADTLEALFFEVERILTAYIALAESEGRVPFSDILPAPRKYWDRFEKSQLVLNGPRAGIHRTGSPPPQIKTDIRVAGRAAA